MILDLRLALPREAYCRAFISFSVEPRLRFNPAQISEEMSTQGQVDLSAQPLLERAYAAFNARDIDTVLMLMAEDVDWPNGMEGGYVHGHQQVREYWTRQWQLVNPNVVPLAYRLEPDGRVALEVYQIVRDLQGQILVDRAIDHVYTIDRGKIKSMEIRESHALGPSRANPGNGRD